MGNKGQRENREERKWIGEIRPFVHGSITINDSALCCGLGGSAASSEPEIADRFVKKLGSSTEGKIYTYCASCTGRFRRCGLSSVYHVLPLIMGVDEKPDIKKSYINRMLTKVK